MQHAWAEMEHDLGYKTHEGVPKETRRRFSSVAGLLEIVDREFRSLRDELKSYEQDIPRRIESEPQEVELDKASLTAFLEQNSLVEELDQEIADAAASEYYVGPISNAAVEDIVGRLKYARITTIEELVEILHQ